MCSSIHASGLSLASKGGAVRLFSFLDPCSWTVLGGTRPKFENFVVPVAAGCRSRARKRASECPESRRAPRNGAPVAQGPGLQASAGAAPCHVPWCSADTARDRGHGERPTVRRSAWTARNTATTRQFRPTSRIPCRALRMNWAARYISSSSTVLIRRRLAA